MYNQLPIPDATIPLAPEKARAANTPGEVTPNDLYHIKNLTVVRDYT